MELNRDGKIQPYFSWEGFHNLFIIYHILLSKSFMRISDFKYIIIIIILE